MGDRSLPFPDQKGEPASGTDETGRNRQDLAEALDGAEGDDFKAERGRGGVCVGTGGQYIDVRQFCCPDDFAQEGCLLLVGLDQGDAHFGHPEFDGDAGKASAGTEVGQGGRSRRCPTLTRVWEQVMGSEERFAEVAGDDVFRGADRSEADASVPTQQYIYIRRYTSQLARGKWGAFDKGREQSRDSGRLHAEFDLITKRHTPAQAKLGTRSIVNGSLL